MPIGKIVNSVMNVVGAVGGKSSQGTASKGAGLFKSIGDLFTGGKPTGSEVGGVIGGFMEVAGSLGQFGLGGQVNKMVDSLGLPDWIGDIAGGVADFATGNFIGAAANGLDALGDGVKAAGKLFDKMKQTDTEGYAEASGKVRGMYNEEPSVSSTQVECAQATSEHTASSIETGREAYNCYQDGRTAEAGRKAVASTRECFAAEAASHPDVSEADAKAADDVMGSIEDAFATFELAADKQSALEHIEKEHGTEIAKMVARFGDADEVTGVEKGQKDAGGGGFLGALGRLGKSIAETVAGVVGGGAGEVFKGAVGSHMQVLELAERGETVLDEFQNMFASGAAGDSASKMAAEKGSQLRM